MKIDNMTYLTIEKDDKKASLVVPVDMPLGLIFDALMEMKGYIVERMVKAQKEESDYAENHMNDDCKKDECCKAEEVPEKE